MTILVEETEKTTTIENVGKTEKDTNDLVIYPVFDHTLKVYINGKFDRTICGKHRIRLAKIKSYKEVR